MERMLMGEMTVEGTIIQALPQYHTSYVFLRRLAKDSRR